MTIWIQGFHLEVDEGARGMTDPGVGCTGLFGAWRTSNPKLFVFVLKILAAILRLGSSLRKVVDSAMTQTSR